MFSDSGLDTVNYMSTANYIGTDSLVAHLIQTLYSLCFNM